MNLDGLIAVLLHILKLLHQQVKPCSSLADVAFVRSDINTLNIIEPQASRLHITFS